MIRHIVLMRFKKNVTKDEINMVFAKLHELEQSIPQILNFSYGPYTSPENLHQGFLHGFTMDFTNEVDRDNYLKHPQHKFVAENFIIPLLEEDYKSIVVFDYIISNNGNKP